MWTCAGRGRHEEMQHGRHTAATDQVFQSPSAYHKLRPRRCAPSGTARSDTPSQAAGCGALPHRLVSTSLASTHRVPASLLSPQPTNACHQQQQNNPSSNNKTPRRDFRAPVLWLRCNADLQSESRCFSKHPSEFNVLNSLAQGLKCACQIGLLLARESNFGLTPFLLLSMTHMGTSGS